MRRNRWFALALAAAVVVSGCKPAAGPVDGDPEWVVGRIEPGEQTGQHIVVCHSIVAKGRAIDVAVDAGVAAGLAEGDVCPS